MVGNNRKRSCSCRGKQGRREIISKSSIRIIITDTIINIMKAVQVLATTKIQTPLPLPVLNRINLTIIKSQKVSIKSSEVDSQMLNIDMMEKKGRETSR